MRKLIVAITAIAFVSALSAPVLAQDKAGGSTAPAAQSGDTMSKGEGMKMSKKTSKKSKKSAKKSGDDSMKQ
jgi:hypothetical protein